MSDTPPDPQHGARGGSRDGPRDSVLARLRQSRAWRRSVAAIGWIDEPVRDGVIARTTPRQDPIDVLVAKIVFSHARNRQQLLGPPPTALGQLDAAQTELLITAAAIAAKASGRLDDAAERQLRNVLSGVGLHSADEGFLASVLAAPPGLDELLRSVRDPHLVSLVYAASLLAADRHDSAGRAWLDYLALRLKLPAETVTRLHSQFGVG